MFPHITGGSDLYLSLYHMEKLCINAMGKKRTQIELLYLHGLILF